MAVKITSERIKKIARGNTGYEVAIEILGGSRQPFMTQIIREKEKENPSQQMIKFCQMRLDAIDELQYELRSDDYDTIERILTVNDPVIGRIKDQ